MCDQWLYTHNLLKWTITCGVSEMIYINDLQKETLLMVNDLIEQGKTFNEICWALQEKGYYFMGERHNGYDIKTLFKIYKDNKYSFVDLRKRRNGLAYWETIKIS